MMKAGFGVWAAGSENETGTAHNLWSWGMQAADHWQQEVGSAVTTPAL